jgi:hypothetical protein
MVDTTQISLTPAQTPEQVPLDIGNVQPMLTPDQLNERALKAHYGLGGVTGLGYEDYQSAFYTGNDQSLRQANAAQLDQINQRNQQQRLQDLAIQKGSALTVDEVRNVLNTPVKPTPTDSVFEDGYGTQFINALDTAASNMKGTFMDSALLQVPSQVADTKAMGSQTIAWRNYVGNRIQDLNADIESQPWYQKAAYFAYSLVPMVYSGQQEALMRGNVPNDAGIQGMGSSVSSQAEALWRMPYEQRKVKFDEVINNIAKTDKRAALNFATAVLGQSASSQFTRDVFAPIDFLPFVGGMSKSAASALMRKGAELNVARTAVRTAVEAEAVPNPTMAPAAKAANAAGDVTEAAVQRIAEQTAQKFEGSHNPAEEAKAFLPTALRTDWKAIESNPGNLSREQMLRLKTDYTDAETNILDAYNNTLRPQRTEIYRAAEDQLQKINATTKDKYPGDAIADISDPIYNPITTTWHQDIKIVNTDGALFSTKEAALNYAEAKGYKGVQLGEDTGRVSSEPTGSPSDLRRKSQIESAEQTYRKAISDLKKKARDKTLAAAVRKDARQNARDLQETFNKHQEELQRINKRLAPVTVSQQGVGYYIRHTVNVNEQDAAVRSLYGIGGNSVAIRGSKSEQWRNALTGKLRIADDSLAKAEVENRKLATYPVSNFYNLLQSEGKFIRDVREGRVRFDPVTGEDIGDLKSGITSLAKGVNPLNGNKKIADEFNQALDYGRKAWNEETSKPGRFFQNPAELQEYYSATFNRQPTFAETRAYFAYTRALSYDWVQRNLAEYKYKARLGVKTHSFNYMDATGNIIQSPKFDAARVGHIPGGEDAILVVDGSANAPKIYSPNSAQFKTVRQELEPQVQSGKLRVLRIYAPEKRELEGLGPVTDERIRYVIAKNTTEEPLNFTQIPRQQGGHFDYDYTRWLKQPNIREERVGNSVTHWMEPDQTVMAIPEGKTGELIRQSLNKVRVALKNGDEAAAEAAAKQHFPQDWEKVKGWFKDQRDEKGKIIRRGLSLDHDFYVVNTNKRIIDRYDIRKQYTDPETGATTFRDGTRSGSDAAQFQTKYTQERDAEGLFEGQNIGTVSDPIFKFEPAKMIDPIPSMNRALQNIIRTSFMDDMKIYSIENWLKEAAPHLKYDEKEIRTSPVYSFKTALENLKNDVPHEVKQNLINNWKKIEDFHGQPNYFDIAAHAANQALDDAMANAGIVKKTLLYPAWKLSDASVAKKPLQLMRSMAYHAKLGLYAPQQLFVNSMTFTLMAPLAPKSVTAGIHGAMLHAWSGVNAAPEFLRALDERAFKLSIPGVIRGWRPGWWQEARRELQATGFAHVGGEYVDLNDQLATNFIGSKGKDFLNHATVFFKKSEQFVRLGAYYTAFNEFRHGKPVGELTLADRMAILRRADDLSMNMSRASNSVWTSGIGAIPLQFFNYTKHAAELFWGKRIGETTTDRALARARILFFNALMFGIPTGLSATGIPVQDYLRKKAADYGYNVGENTAVSAFMEGFPAFMSALITGVGDPKKGNWYNIGSRYGLGGMTQVREALFGDKTWYQLIGGPSFSIIQNTLESAHPFFAYVGHLMTGQNPPGLKVEDVVEAAKEISSVNSAHKFYLALSTGQWFNKSGASLGQVSPANAAFMALTGLEPGATPDLYQKNLIKNEEEAAQKTAFKRWRKGLWAGYTNDPENAQFYRNRAMATLKAADYPIEKYGSFFAIGNKGYENLIDSTNQRFYMKDNPMSKRDTRIEQYRNLLQKDQ